MAPVAGSSYRVIPILKSDAMRRLKEVRPSKLEVRVAAPDDLRPLDDDDSTVQQSLANMKEVAGGKTVEIVVSSGRSRQPLRSGRVRRLVRWFAREVEEGRGGIEKLKVSGVAGDDEEVAKVALDLLKEVLQSSEELTFPNNDMDGSYNIRKVFIRRAFQAHNEQLASLFRRDGP